MKNTRKTSTKTLVLYGLLTAIIVLMAFTPVGYLKTFGVEISFLIIPVIVGAVVLGPGAGAFLGGVFGITSFAQCFGMSPFGMELMAINPVFTFITCVFTRILMGFFCGLIFKTIKNKGKTIPYIISSISGALLNTLFFVLAIILLFGNSDYIKAMQGGKNVLAFFVAFVGFNGFVEAIVAAVAGTAISKAVAKISK